MFLSQVEAGNSIRILCLPDPTIRAQAIRLGIYEGAELLCSQAIRKGPVLLQNRYQEIAIGYGLAKQIEVEQMIKEKI